MRTRSTKRNIMESKGFVVYGDIEAVLNELTDDQVGQLFRGMVSYHNTGKAPELSGILKFVFIPIRQQMDRNVEKYTEKSEKMRENARKRWQGSQGSVMQLHANDANTITNTITKTITNTMQNAIASPDGDLSSLSLSVISHLNEAAGTNYRTDDADSVRLISELAAKGYTAEQMKTVIDKKVSSWLGDPKVEQYLRPRTLFGPKFETYLNEPDSARRQRQAEETKRKDRAARNGRRLEEAEKELAGIRDQIAALPSVRDDPEAFERRSRLKDREALLENEIARIKGGK